MRALAMMVLIGAMFTLPGDAADAPRPDFDKTRNLISNASFEMDWMHNSVTSNSRFYLLEQSDWGYAQADGLPDCWVVSPTSYRDTAEAKFDKASLRLQGNASQVVYLCGETDPKDGGAHYNAFRPLPAALTKHVKPRALRFGAWCKAKDAAAQATLSVTVEYAAGEKITPRAHSVAFAKGTHDWEYREIKVPVAADFGVPHAAVVRLSYSGGGAV